MTYCNPDNDWSLILQKLPAGWQHQATTLGAMVRKRTIKSPEILLRLLLVHVGKGKSLRATAAWAKECGICDITDMGLLKALSRSDEWLRWMTDAMLHEMEWSVDAACKEIPFRIRLVDATHVSGPGSKGSCWRLHYSAQLPGLRSGTTKVTDSKTAEGFDNFTVKPGDLMVGDRAYCQRKGIVRVLENGGDALVRFHSTNLPLVTRTGTSWEPLVQLRKLTELEEKEWDVWFRHPDEDRLIKGRLWALKKTKEDAEKAKEALLKAARKKQRKVREHTLEFAEYIVLFTTAGRGKLPGRLVGQLYRGRWQIELVFKRFKSIAGLGRLHNKDPNSCRAWLFGKLLLILLAERFYQIAESFFPSTGRRNAIPPR